MSLRPSLLCPSACRHLLICCAASLSLQVLGESVSIGGEASLARVGRHAAQQAPKRMIRLEAQQPGSGYHSRQRSARASLAEQNADINGILQFSAIDMGEGNGSAYLKQDGENTKVFPKVTCGDDEDSIQLCHWEYTASNESYKFLRLRSPKPCEGEEEWECCLKWEQSAPGSKVSLANCWTECDGANCQWCMFNIPDSRYEWFVPRYEGENCAATQTACLTPGNCPCLHGDEHTGAVDLQVQGSEGCELNWATA
mmetsp:Transcript_23816/g.43322  ORF Transcript_23816/g.43322 Transcript_23816/m.43322 type:complete len:255 (+) Transcript_23816:66-830(+)